MMHCLSDFVSVARGRLNFYSASIDFNLERDGPAVNAHMIYDRKIHKNS